jgi:hypothetical protein
MAPTNITLNVVLLQENESWVAQALEYDITAQGKTIQNATDALERTVVGQLLVDITHGSQPFEGIEQAPKIYWEHFHSAKRLEDSRKPLRVPISSPARINLEDTRVFA